MLSKESKGQNSGSTHKNRRNTVLKILEFGVLHFVLISAETNSAQGVLCRS